MLSVDVRDDDNMQRLFGKKSRADHDGLKRQPQDIT
jgi:hypothetical protein